MWYFNSRSRSLSSSRSRNQLSIRFIAPYPRQRSVGLLRSTEPSCLSQRGAAFARSVSMNRTWPRVPFPIASTRLSASPSVPAGGGRDTEIPGYLDNGFRNLPEPLGNPVPMRRLQREDLEDQHVERALRNGNSVQEAVEML